MRSTAIYFLSVTCVLLLASGKWSGTKNSSVIKQQSEQSEGGQLYAKYCLTCHQVNGKGVRNMFPPLAGNEKITGTPDDLIKIVLFGLQGPITVNEQGI